MTLSRPSLLAAAALGLAAVSPLSAQTYGIQAQRTPCATLRSLVVTHGQAIISTGPFLYERYVDREGLCHIEETTEAAWVPAADNAQCFVGYRCVNRERSRFAPR